MTNLRGVTIEKIEKLKAPLTQLINKEREFIGYLFNFV